MEIRQEVTPAPATVSERFPRIIIIPIATIPYHAIDDTTTTDYFAKREWTCASIKLGLRRGCDVPVIDRSDVATDELREQNRFFIVVAVSKFSRLSVVLLVCQLTTVQLPDKPPRRLRFP